MNNDFNVEQTDDYRLVDVDGEVDIASVPAFRSSFDVRSEGRETPTIVDLSNCKYMDSTGISVLVAQRRGDPTLGVVLPPDHKLQRLFHVAGLHKILNVFPTREAALEAAHDVERDGP